MFFVTRNVRCGREVFSKEKIIFTGTCRISPICRTPAGSYINTASAVNISREFRRSIRLLAVTHTLHCVASVAINAWVRLNGRTAEFNGINSGTTRQPAWASLLAADIYTYGRPLILAARAALQIEVHNVAVRAPNGSRRRMAVVMRLHNHVHSRARARMCH